MLRLLCAKLRQDGKFLLEVLVGFVWESELRARLVDKL